MTQTRRVRDIMLSLSEYGVVEQDATLLDALHALEDAQARLPEGRYPHRAVLVRNAHGAIIGKLGHLAFLRALSPWRKSVEAEAVFERALMSDDMRASSMEALSLLTDDLINVCESARNVTVGQACVPTTASIDEKAPLVEAITVFVDNRTLSLLVRRGWETVGVLRLSDLFDEIARQVRRDECETGE
ncbi:CBS domain-containing protein [Myxococcota bacterium]